MEHSQLNWTFETEHVFIRDVRFFHTISGVAPGPGSRVVYDWPASVCFGPMLLKSPVACVCMLMCVHRGPMLLCVRVCVAP